MSTMNNSKRKISTKNNAHKQEDLSNLEQLDRSKCNEIRGGVGLHKILKEANNVMKDINNHDGFVAH